MPKQTQRPLAMVPRYLLTKQEAAASLGMSVDSFERYVLPFLHVIRRGQLVLIPPAEIERWIRSNALPAVDQPASRSAK